MPTNFPTSVDVLTNPVSNDSLNSPSHSAQHANANDAIEAIETYLLNGGQGLTHINTTTWTLQSAVILDNVFTSAYTNYLIYIQVDGNTATNILWQFRAAGSTLASGYYGGSMAASFSSAATNYGPNTNNATALNLAGHADVQGNFWISTPTNVATRTGFHGTYTESSGMRGFVFGGTRNNTEAHDGFRISLNSAGTFTGAVRIYGLRNS